MGAAINSMKNDDQIPSELVQELSMSKNDVTILIAGIMRDTSTMCEYIEAVRGAVVAHPEWFRPGQDEQTVVDHLTILRHHLVIARMRAEVMMKQIIIDPPYPADRGDDILNVE